MGTKVIETLDRLRRSNPSGAKFHGCAFLLLGRSPADQDPSRRCDSDQGAGTRGDSRTWDNRHLRSIAHKSRTQVVVELAPVFTEPTTAAWRRDIPPPQRR